ncbi:MAG: phosphatidylglycerophosphatase A [Bacillota bacterium]
MGAATTTSRVPDPRFLVSHPAHFIALGFGSGLLRPAPGTWGTLFAIALYWALALFLTPLAIAIVAIPLFFVGIWACDVTGRDIGVADHGSMVWDEIVAFLPLAALATVYPTDAPTRFRAVYLQVIAFLLFRIFDVWKPFPVRNVERRLKGGLGVMADDVLAAIYAALVFLVVAWLV